MSNADNIELEGTVVDSFRGGRFSVELDNGNLVNCMLSGRLRKNFIKIIKRDRVTVSLSPYDLNNGRITWRHSPQKKKISVDSPVQDDVDPHIDVENFSNNTNIPVDGEGAFPDSAHLN